MQKHRVFINAIMSLVQIILVGGVLFFLYRFLLKTIGVEQLGIWSLVLATTCVTQIASFGLSGSVVKFVAKYVARGEDNNVSGVIQTAVISLAVIVGFILLAGYPLIKWVLGLVIPLNSIEYGLRILPFALFSLWITTITSVFQSGLDGFQRIYIRNLLMIIGSIFYALLCFMLAPKYGLIGLAYAQIINNSVILIVSWILIKRFLSLLPAIPYQWNKNLFKEIVSYGINFQIVSVTTMFYDPITKALLSKFGGLSMVGYYEMANRMVQQFRALIVSANQVLVPAIADLQEKKPERIRSVYLTSYNLVFYLALPLYTLIIISIPLISEIWIGHYERIFVIFGTLLAIGYFLNTLSVPAYFANFGTGALRWNVIGHITIGILNAALGVILGMFFDGFGVVVAWVITLSLGSAVIYVAYHLSNEITLSELFPRDSRAMFVFYTIILLIALLIQHGFNHTLWTIAMNIIVILSSSLFIFIPFWLHPMRKRVTGWVNELIFSRSVN
jgi:O-antigen/teichoic acid export membrane protein